MNPDNKNGGLYKSAAAVFFISTFCRIFGFLRGVVISQLFGTGAESDSYFMAVKIFNIFALLFGYMWTTSYTPLYTQVYTEDSTRKKADRLTGNLLTILLLASLLITVLCEIFAAPICRLIAAGFDGEKLQMTIRMTQIVLPAIPLFGLYYFFSAVLNAQKKFKIVEASTMFVGLGVILSVLTLKGVIGPYAMALGTFLAYLLQFLMMLPSILRSFRYRPTLNFRDGRTREFFRLLAPSAIGVAAAEINSIIDSALASTLPDGNVSSMEYAQRINTFAISLLVMPIITVIFTRLSECAAEKKKDGFNVTIRNGLEALGVICIPISALMAAACEDIIRIVYQRGEFDDTSVMMTRGVLFFYIIGLIFYGVKSLLNRAFYANKDTKTPMVTGIIYIALNVGLNLCLIRPMGIGGLALANSIALCLAAGVMIAAYVKKYGMWNMDGSLREFTMIFLSAAVCVLVYLGLRHFLAYNLYLRFFLPGLAAVLVYLVLARLFRIRPFMELWTMLISKRIKKR